MNLPPRCSGPIAWYRHDLESDTPSWTFTLSDAAIGELEFAAERLADQSIRDLQLDDIDLPSLSAQLGAITDVIVRGRGVVLLRGLRVDSYTESEAELIFASIGLQIGSLRPQNANGDLMGHVRDIGADSDEPSTRIYQTNERQTFHTDSADVVALMCLQKSMTGGDSLVVSAATIYNEMLDQRPDLAARLFDPVATDRRGEIPAGKKPWFEIPILSWFDDELTVLYQRQYINSASRFAQAIRLDDQQIEAMDLFDELANNPRIHASMTFERGDVQFVYNHALLHDRTSFVDWPAPAPKRHLLRLWLSIPGDRRLPEVFAQRYGSIEIGNRGGIVVPP